MIDTPVEPTVGRLRAVIDTSVEPTVGRLRAMIGTPVEPTVGRLRAMAGVQAVGAEEQPTNGRLYGRGHASAMVQNDFHVLLGVVHRAVRVVGIPARARGGGRA